MDDVTWSEVHDLNKRMDALEKQVKALVANASARKRSDLVLWQQVNSLTQRLDAMEKQQQEAGKALVDKTVRQLQEAETESRALVSAVLAELGVTENKGHVENK